MKDLNISLKTVALLGKTAVDTGMIRNLLERKGTKNIISNSKKRQI